LPPSCTLFPYARSSDLSGMPRHLLHQHVDGGIRFGLRMEMDVRIRHARGDFVQQAQHRLLVELPLFGYPMETPIMHVAQLIQIKDRKSTRLNSSHVTSS